MGDPSLPKYINRGGDLVFPQPFLHQGVKLHGFFLEANLQRVEELLARSLPQNKGLHFRPLSSLVLLTVAVIPKIASTDDAGRHFGWASEIDVAFWIPVVSTQHGRPRLDWFIPYIFVDNPYAMAIGRESYGFPKSLGSFALPRAIFGEHLPLFAPLGSRVSDDDSYQLDVIGLSQFKPETQAKRLPLFSILPTQTSKTTGDFIQQLGPLFFGSTGELLERFGNGVGQLQSFQDRALSVLFLRQLRAVESPHHASYQELLRAPAKVTAMRGGGVMPHGYQVRFSPCASHPIAAELGLGEVTEAKAAFWLDFDFLMDKGQRLTETVSQPLPRRRKRIAILGGGIGSLSAALAITEQPGWQSEYELTVYQAGWRLGGKCASSHNPAEHQRIEEHGLHLWFGCYENAFRMIRRCYEELQRPEGHPMRTWRDAFTPHHGAVLHQKEAAGWGPWPFYLPSNSGAPGEARREDLFGLLQSVSSWLRSSLEEASTVKRLPQKLSLLAARLMQALQQTLHSPHGLRALSLLAAPAQIAALRRGLRWLLAREADSRLWLMLDFVLTVLYGLLQDQALTRGLRVLDDEEFSAWLARHGASKETLQSAPLRVLYDLVFAYEGGDLSRPNLAASTALQIALRLPFDYRGSFMYAMQAGMGETVITPLYETLRQRGVRFEFFHRVKQLGLSYDQRALSTVRLSRQARVTEGEYQPLIDVGGLACWPEIPLYEQLTEGAKLRGRNLEAPDERDELEEVVLHAGRDFDSVILGIPVGALPPLCTELAAAHPKWQQMLSKVKTVATIATQLWSKHPPHPTFLQGTYDGALSTCADMSHLLPKEAWTKEQQPNSLAYLCGAYQEESDPKAIVHDFLERKAGYLWPGAKDQELIVSTYVRVNTAPAERYVLSLAGSGAGRLKPDASGVEGLFLAGDWTDNGLNVGCIEATVISGMQCARGVTGHPTWIYGEHWGEPRQAAAVAAANKKQARVG